ncbi:MAG: hypothetical protein QOI31_1019 [Solirubrobacterales bacterium]|jgi:Tol biopolymer transport system component|nr:hypothetical protein [Solirubrobacterales bacterium]
MSGGRKRNIWRSLLVVIAGLGCVASEAQAAYPGEDGKIAFSRGGFGTFTIWEANPDGTGDLDLGSGGSGAAFDRLNPAYSPDGKKIAFNQGSNLWVMDADGTGAHQLAPSLYQPTWSPDGSKLAVYRTGTPNGIAIINAETGAEINFIPSPAGSESAGSYINPAWHPTDPNKIVVVWSRCCFRDPINFAPRQQTDLVTISPSGGSHTPLTDDLKVEATPDWAPNGNSLLFTQRQGTDDPVASVGLFTMPAAGGTKAPLTTTADLDAVYSPSGSKILFVRESPSTPELAVMNANGSNPQILDPGNPGEYAPTWQPHPSGELIVNTPKDTQDPNTADGACDTDSGKAGDQCTLRAAIQEANVREGPDKIEFKIKKKDLDPIEPATPLPPITGAGDIDALSQPGASAIKPLIELSGKKVPTATGLDLRGSDSFVKGLIVHGFKGGIGIKLAGTGGYNLQSSWFGVEPGKEGFVAKPNRVGVEVSSPANTIVANIFSANGDVAGFGTYASGLDREGTTPADQHAATLRGLGGGLHLEGGAQSTDIAGNTFGLDPEGERIGSDKPGFGNLDFGNVAGILLAPTSGTVLNTTIGNDSAADANVFSGNIAGIAALGSGGDVTSVDVNRNFIGPSGSDTPAKGVGNVLGVLVSGNVSAFDLGRPGELSNEIQGNVVGVVMGGAGVVNSSIEGNEIGDGRNLGDLVKDLEAKEPTFGRHNLFGVILGDTVGVDLGGASGNSIVGNVIGVQVGGESSQGNEIQNNEIGLLTAPGGKIEELKVKKLGSVIGLLGQGGTGNQVEGNSIVGTAIGDLSVDTTGWTVASNTFDKNAIGQIEGNPAGMTVDGNTYKAGGIGLAMVADEFAKGERDASNTDGNPVGVKDRKEPYQADNADVGLDTAAPLVGTADLTATAAAVDPPDPGSGNVIQDNTMGGLASGQGNWIGAFLAGDIQDTTFGTGAAPSIGENQVVKNRVAGVWIGQDSGTQAEIDLRGNSISDNHTFTGPSRGLEGLGIDLIEGVPDPDDFASSFGPTTNDPGDADAGPNGLQNYPEITSATDAGSTIQIVGTLSSKPSTTYSIEVSASVSCGKFAFGEGDSAVSRYDVTTNASGVASIDMAVPEAPSARKITATATGPEGTSEFSQCVTVP